MSPAKLITLKNEQYDGQCEIKDDHFSFIIKDYQNVGQCEIKDDYFSFIIKDYQTCFDDYAVISPSHSTISIPIIIESSVFENNRLLITGSLLKVEQGKTYQPILTYGRYNYQINKKALDLFVRYGIATLKVFDKILVCPECDAAIYTIRPGCPSCGSAFTRPDQLVHHYACGNVDFLELYTINRKKGSLTCGKCQKEDLIINVDYDVSVGLQRCMDCGWTGNGNKLIGRCHDCETSFLITEAKEIELKEYKML